MKNGIQAVSPSSWAVAPTSDASPGCDSAVSPLPLNCSPDRVILPVIPGASQCTPILPGMHWHKRGDRTKNGMTPLFFNSNPGRFVAAGSLCFCCSRFGLQVHFYEEKTLQTRFLPGLSGSRKFPVSGPYKNMCDPPIGIRNSWSASCSIL